MVSTALLGDTKTGLVQGLSPEDCVRVHAALDYAFGAYGARLAGSGQSAFEFSLGAAGTLAYLNTDAETRIAGLVFELALMDPAVFTDLEERFGAGVVALVQGVHQLIRLRDLTAGGEPVGSG